MIAFLSGNIKRKASDSVVVEVNGVGYRVFVTEQVMRALPQLGDATELEIHTVVKENDISLFGFIEESECRLFQVLMGTTGVGPKMALAILSHCPWQELIVAIDHEDVTRLRAVKGVGEKTAKMLILALKSKLEQFGEVLQSPQKGRRRIDTSIANDLESALLNLGYSRSDVQRTVSHLSVNSETNIQSAIKQSLQLLSGGLK